MHDWTEKTEMIDRRIEQAAGTQEETNLLSPGKVSDVQIDRETFVLKKHTAMLIEDV